MAQNDSFIDQALQSVNQLVGVGQDGATPTAAAEPAGRGSQGDGADRLFAAMIGAESNGQQFDASGRPLTSRAGAIGRAQVMPGTAPEAAKLAGLAFDENRYRNDADYNEALGRAYHRAQFDRFGDLAKSAAAYNAGPGAVDAAIRRAAAAGDPSSWLKFVPAETQNYVGKTMRNAGFAAGDTATQPAIPGAAPGAQQPAGYYAGRNDLITYSDETPKGDRSFVDGVKAGAVHGLKSSQALLYGGAALVDRTINGEAGSDFQNWALDRYKEKSEESAKDLRAPSFTEAAFGDASMKDWLSESIGYLGYQVAETIATGGLGGLIGKSIGKGAVQAVATRAVEGEVARLAATEAGKKMAKEGLVDLAAKNVAAKMSAGTAVFANNLRQTGGGVYADAVDREQSTGEDVDLTKVWLASLASAGLDTAVDISAAKGILGLKEGSSAATFARRAATEVPKEMGKQGGTEAVQSLIETYGSGGDPLTKDALIQAVDEGAVGALGGAAGGAASARHRAKAADPIAAVREKAAEADSPLSKAAVSGADGAAAALPDPAKSQEKPDPIIESVTQIEDQVRTGGLLDAIRAEGSPADVKQFVADLAVAKSPSTAQHLREQAVSRLELAAGWAAQNAPAQEAPDSLDPKSFAPSKEQATQELQRAAAPIVEALQDPALERVMSEQDRMALEGLAGTATDLGVPTLQRQDATQQAFEIIGRYAAPATDRTTAPAAPALLGQQGQQDAAPTVQKPAALFVPLPPVDPAAAAPVAPAPPVAIAPSTPEGRGANDAASVRMAQLDDESGQSGSPENIPTARDIDRTRDLLAGAADAATHRAAALEEQEQGPEVSAAPAPAPAPGQGAAATPPPLATPEAPAPQEQAADTAGEFVAPDVEQQVQPETLSSTTEVAAPVVATPPGAGTAARRKRVATLDQLANMGFDTVRRTDDGVHQLYNHKTDQSFPLEGQADAQLARAAIARRVDANANQAATSDTNDKRFTQAMGEAGNYARGQETVINGVTFRADNPRGTVRSGTSPDGKTWESTMVHHYGDIVGTKGADGDPVDAFIGPRPDSDKVYVVDQRNADGTFDEHKTMLGFTSEEAARKGYLDNYEEGWAGLGAITEMSPQEFKSWVKSDATQKPASPSFGALSPEAAGPARAITVNDGGQAVTLPLLDEAHLGEEQGSTDRGAAGLQVNKTQAKTLQQLAKAFGKKIEFFTDDHAESPIGDGFIRPEDPGTIYLNARSGISPLAVFGHEMTHTIRIENEAAYQVMSSVIATKVKPGGAHDFRNDYGGTEAGPNPDSKLGNRELEELTSDLTGNLMQDSGFWGEVFSKAQELHGAEAQGIIARLAEFVYRKVDQLVVSFKQGGYRANEFVTDAQAVRAAVRDGLAKYIKDAGVTRTAMQAKILRAGQQAKKSATRPGAAQTYTGDSTNIAQDEQPQDAPARADDPAGGLGRRDDQGGVLQEVPSYGEARPGAVSVVGRHYSAAPRASLSTAHAGTGLRGAERERLERSADPRIKQRSYFYVDTGNGISPESGVGGHAHEVRLNNIYDPATGAIPRGLDDNDFESAVLDAGFDGYLSPGFHGSQAAAVLLGPQHTAVPVKSLGEQPKEQVLKKGLLSREVAAVDVKAIPGASISSGTLAIPEGSRDAANAEMERIGSVARFSRERLSTPAQQLDLVRQLYHGTEKWMKAPNGRPTQLNERQWLHVRTPAFKAWFGDWEKAHANGGAWNHDDVSKVVDASGEPLVVYHGTDNAGFTRFRETGGKQRGDLGIFATSNRHMADSYVHRGRAATVAEGDIDTEDDSNRKGGVYALFMNVRHPNEAYFDGAHWDGARPDQFEVYDADGEVARTEGGREFMSLEEAQSLAEEIGGSLEDASPSGETTDSVVREARRLNNDGAIIHDVVDDGGGSGGYYGDPANVYVAFDPGQIKSADFNGGAYAVGDDDIRRSERRGPREAPAQGPQVDRSSRSIIRKPAEFKSTHGLAQGTNGVRQIGEALNRRTLEEFGQIADNDTSSEARDAIAAAMVDEVEHQIGKIRSSGVGWYSKDYPKALRALGAIYPELQRSSAARGVFTALLAVTSNGERVVRNIAMARQLYEAHRSGVDMLQNLPGTMRGEALRGNIEVISQLLDQVGPGGLAKVLLKEMRVGDINAQLRKEGKKPSSDYPASMTMPRAALFFGPKLGAFYANLMGSQGYLTMDLWWSRTFNRMRGTLIPQPTEGSLEYMRGAMGRPDATIEELIEFAEPHRKAYASRGYKNGSDIEKRANTFMKSAALDLNEAPSHSSDREFMVESAAKAQELLRQRGVDMTIADIQAALWYYEKRLYGALGSRVLDDIGYSEALKNAAQSDRPVGSASRSGGEPDASAADEAVRPQRGGAGGDQEDISGRGIKRSAGRDGGGRTGAGGQESGSLASPERAVQEDVKQGLIGKNDPLPGAPQIKGFTGPDPQLVSVAEQYARDNGIELRRQAQYVQVDPERASHIAQAYADMAHAPQDPRVKEAYENLVQQTVAQYKALERAGYRFWFIDPTSRSNEDYVSSPWNAMRDIRANRQMGVFPTEDGFGTNADFDPAGNPLLADTGIQWPAGSLDGEPRRVLANDLFRAVHDAFGHGLEGAGFRAQGEENAWQAHVRLFTGSAVGAITTETRGQNSWLNYGPHGERNRDAKVEDTVFADQKTGLMPEWTWAEGRVDDEPGAAAGPGADKPVRRSAARPQFFSQLQRSIEQAPARLAAMAAPQWKLWLDANSSKLGIKKDEIEWSGLPEFLKLKGKEKVSRDELVAYLADNHVQVEETVLGDVGDGLPAGWSAEEEEEDPGLWLVRDAQGIMVGQALGRQAAIQDAGVRDERSTSDTRYSKYVVPGGANYREVLVTLPSATSDDRIRAHLMKAYGYKRSELNEISTAARQKATEDLGGPFYKSNHWDQPNILVHMRVDDRTDADGNKVLFLNDLQSDWGQEGKKRGFIQKYAAEDVKPIAAGDARATQPDLFWYFEVPGNALQIAKSKYASESAARGYIVNEKVVSGEVPTGPFVTDTKAWVALGLKRAIMMAVEGGYDKVAIINGEQAAEMFDLSKQVGEIRYEKVNDQDLWEIEVDDRGGSQILHEDEIPASRIEELVGKEVAQKIVSGEGERFTPDSPRDWRRLSGLDLKVGGEGMQAFYDHIVPQAMRDVAKRLGGSVSTSVITSSELGLWEPEEGQGDGSLVPTKASTQPAIDITPAMRETVLGGVPLFSRARGPQTETPAFKAWFKGSKVVNEDGSPKVVYHGTAGDFTEFDATGSGRNYGFRGGNKGIFFTSNPEAASAYAEQPALAYLDPKDPEGANFGNGRANIMPAYLSLQQPLIVSTKHSPDKFFDKNYETLWARVAKQGADGIIVRGTGEAYRRDVYVATGPEQIKSAIGNDGGFDPTDPDIRKSRSRPWGDLPPAVIGARLGEAGKHADHAAAKAGDLDAAVRLVDDVLPDSAVEQLRELVGDSNALLVPVHAQEAAGRNKIPVAVADALSGRLSLTIDSRITQSNEVRRTGADGMARIARQPEFAGEVEPGRNYVLVDDTLTQGGTFAQLK
ncbi:MAG: transglycosylase SLT domain-containing protein, partial [Burkholderiales bacterium]